MPGPNTIPMGNIRGNWILSTTLSPGIATPNTTVEQTFTITGLNVGDFVDVSKPTTQAGLGIVNARVSATNTLAIAFNNVTSATITPTASEIYQINITRPENVTAAGQSILTQLV